MSLVQKSRSLEEKIDKASGLPLALRAAQAVVIVPETAALLVELSAAVEFLQHEYTDLLKRVMALEVKENFRA